MTKYLIWRRTRWYAYFIVYSLTLEINNGENVKMWDFEQNCIKSYRMLGPLLSKSLLKSNYLKFYKFWKLNIRNFNTSRRINNASHIFLNHAHKHTKHVIWFLKSFLIYIHSNNYILTIFKNTTCLPVYVVYSRHVLNYIVYGLFIL